MMSGKAGFARRFFFVSRNPRLLEVAIIKKIIIIQLSIVIAKTFCNHERKERFRDNKKSNLHFSAESCKVRREIKFEVNKMKIMKIINSKLPSSQSEEVN